MCEYQTANEHDTLNEQGHKKENVKDITTQNRGKQLDDVHAQKESSYNDCQDILFIFDDDIERMDYLHS
jgi:hypothetical protein